MPCTTPLTTLLFCSAKTTRENETADVQSNTDRAFSPYVLFTGIQIAQELEHNPFMRVDEVAVRSATGTDDGVGAMKQLREMKNNFRPPPETAGRFPAL